jgi:hypothetical protein
VRSKQDIAYWFNRQLVDKQMGGNHFCINCAVEGHFHFLRSSPKLPLLDMICSSWWWFLTLNFCMHTESTLADRFNGKLLVHDVFVRDHLAAEDVVVISAGGNDIALRPSLGTILSVIALLSQPMGAIDSGWAIGLGHFKSLFKTRVEGYIKSLTAKQKPKMVVVCMIYYLDEVAGGSWADRVLSLLGYNSNPAKLQLLIRTVFRIATQEIKVDEVEVRAFPLFEVLDGKTSSDYEQRVEPSVQGGEKIGRAVVDFIAKEFEGLQGTREDPIVVG